MTGPATVSANEARWLALEGQGLGRPRPKRATAKHLRATIDTIGVLQLDAVNVVARTQELVPFSRVGPYDRAALDALSGPGGELFEYWGHAASLLPFDLHPLLRWRMADHAEHTARGPAVGTRLRAWAEEHAGYIATVLDEVRAKGPIPASALEDPRRRVGEWWGRRSVGRQVLELLFATGQLAAWRTGTFERVYDLPERVLPAEVLARPTPTREEAQCELLLRAASALGVATVADLAWYHYVPPRDAKARVAELVASGRLEQLAVEGWRQPGHRRPETRARRPTRETATLLSPFDPLIWQRERTSRIFAFDFTIEIYVPEPKRRYGYYVLPLLLGDRLVARFDLKADRVGRALLVRGSFAEDGVDHDEVATAAADELHRLGTFLDLDALAVADRGNLAPAVRRVTS